MSGVKTFIVKFDEEFKGKIELNGLTIFLGSMFRDRKELTKFGQVISNPIENPGFTVKEGEYVWFHHNIAARQLQTGPSGNKYVDSQYMVDSLEKHYSIPPDLIYAYTEDGEVKCPPPYCFVKPIEKPSIKSKLWTPDQDLKLESGQIVGGKKELFKHIGEMWCSNPSLEAKGIFKGDIVMYEIDSEYEINVYNEKLWRMREAYIYGKFIRP